MGSGDTQRPKAASEAEQCWLQDGSSWENKKCKALPRVWRTACLQEGLLLLPTQALCGTLQPPDALPLCLTVQQAGHQTAGQPHGPSPGADCDWQWWALG